MLILAMFICVAMLSFSELRAFDDFFDVSLIFFESALGSWDLSIFDGKIVEFKSSGSEGSGGNDIWIQHNKYPNVFVRFFHIKGSEKVTNHFGTETGVSTLFFLIKSII